MTWKIKALTKAQVSPRFLPYFFRSVGDYERWGMKNHTTSSKSYLPKGKKLKKSQTHMLESKRKAQVGYGDGEKSLKTSVQMARSWSTLLLVEGPSEDMIAIIVFVFEVFTLFITFSLSFLYLFSSHKFQIPWHRGGIVFGSCK